MQANPTTQPALPEAQTRRRLLVLVDGLFPGHQHYRADMILARAHGAQVLVVAPALPLPRERWIIDLDAREAKARANLRSWIDALADATETVHGEIGDEKPRLAVADALEGFAADEFLTTLTPRGSEPAERPPIERLRDRFATAPPAPALRVGHA